jgi:hypothetical protein
MYQLGVHATGLLLLFVWRRRRAGEHAAVDGGKSMDDRSLDGKVLTGWTKLQRPLQVLEIV